MRARMRLAGVAAALAFGAAALTGCVDAPVDPGSTTPAVPHLQYTDETAPPDWIATLPDASDGPVAMWVHDGHGNEVLRIVRIDTSACPHTPASLTFDGASAYTAVFEPGTGDECTERAGVVVTDFTHVPSFGLEGATVEVSDTDRPGQGWTVGIGDLAVP